MVLIFGGVSRYYTWVFYFKNYNSNTDFRQKKKVEVFLVGSSFILQFYSIKQNLTNAVQKALSKYLSPSQK